MAPRDDSPDNGNDPIDDLACFSLAEGIRDRAPKTGGTSPATTPSCGKMSSTSRGSITLQHDGETVYIGGRNLDDDSTPHIQFLRGILYDRAPWVREMSEAALMAAQESAAVIERFESDDLE